MVRLLLVTTFFLCPPVLAHTEKGPEPCELQLSPLHLSQIRLMNFIKKITGEIEHSFPSERFVRVAIGRGMGPIVAGLQARGSQATSLPLQVNFGGVLTLEAEERFNAVVDAYLPADELRRGKGLLLMIYDETPTAFISFAAQLEKYLKKNKIPTDHLGVEFITSQDKHRWVSDILEQKFSGHKLANVRPLALANELRHWLRDSAIGYELSVHEFKMNDAFGDKPLFLAHTQRPSFTVFVETLKQQ